MAQLIVESGQQRAEHNLSAGTTLIGRHPTSTVHLADPTVSGRHAQIVCAGQQYFLEDLQSRNGTFINEQPIVARTELLHNDLVRLGDTRLRFFNPAAADGLADAPHLLVPGGPTSDPVDDNVLPGRLAVAGTVPTRHGVEDDSRVEFTDSQGTESTIMGEVESKGRFDVLEANPAAKLRAVLDISSSLAGTVDLNTLLPRILDRLFNIFKYADRGCILLKDEKTGEMIPRGIKHRRPGLDATVRLSSTIVQRVLENKTGILSADASADQQFLGSESISELHIRSMMCVPLLGLDGDPKGLISIDSQNPLGQFSTDDLELLMVVADQAALSYESARLMESHVAKQKQDSELQIAKNIQRALLPERLPVVNNYEFYASYHSAQAVGGDYYDCFALSDGKVAIAFGDVAGKGVPGALIMSRLSSCVQSTLRHVEDVQAAMLAINDHMCNRAVEGRFVTFVLGIVDTRKHLVQLANAGHMPPVIRKGQGPIGHFDDDELVGPPLGVVEDYPYDTETCSLDPGDMVVIVTDGVDDAMNAAGELYGSQRTISFIENGPPKAEALGQALLADVRRHAAGHPQNDDITIMAFGRNP